MSLRCLFGHSWRIISIQNYLDSSYGEEQKSNYGTKICTICKKTKVFVNYGGGLIDSSIIDMLEKGEI